MEVYTAALEGRQHGLPGEICRCPAKRVPYWQQHGMQRQKSAEAIVDDCTITEGLNCKARTETRVLQGVEMQRQQALEPKQQPGRKSECCAGSHQARVTTEGPAVHDRISLEQMSRIHIISAMS